MKIFVKFNGRMVFSWMCSTKPVTFGIPHTRASLEIRLNRSFTEYMRPHPRQACPIDCSVCSIAQTTLVDSYLGHPRIRIEARWLFCMRSLEDPHSPSLLRHECVRHPEACSGSAKLHTFSQSRILWRRKTVRDEGRSPWNCFGKR